MNLQKYLFMHKEVIYNLQMKILCQLIFFNQTIIFSFNCMNKVDIFLKISRPKAKVWTFFGNFP